MKNILQDNKVNSWSDQVAMQIATLAGVGRFPKAPGTFGTLATVPLCYFVQHAGFMVHVVTLLVVIVVGIWATEVACQYYGRKDPSQVVVDEAAGMLLTMLAVPFGWLWLLAGFLLFRFFDIWKPWPVGWLDRELPGSWGVMADDLAAGLYAWSILMIVAWMV